MKKILCLIPTLVLSAAIARADFGGTDRIAGDAAFTETAGSRAAAISAMAEQVLQAPAAGQKEDDDLKLAGPVYSNVLKAEAMFKSAALPSAEELLGSWDLVTAATVKKMGNFGFVTRYLSFGKTETGLAAKIRKNLKYTEHAVALNETSAVFSDTHKTEDYVYTSEFVCRIAEKNGLICEIHGNVAYPQKQKRLPNAYLMLRKH